MKKCKITNQLKLNWKIVKNKKNKEKIKRDGKKGNVQNANRKDMTRDNVRKFKMIKNCLI